MSCVHGKTSALDPLTEFLHRHMNRHLEHRTYADVPCYNPRGLHRAIAEHLPAPRTLLGAWREMRESWRRQQTELDYTFDAPVPASRPDSAARACRLEASMGGLAPHADRGGARVRIASAASPTTSEPGLRTAACSRARHPGARSVRVQGRSSGRVRGTGGGNRAPGVGEGKPNFSRRRACRR